ERRPGSSASSGERTGSRASGRAYPSGAWVRGPTARPPSPPATRMNRTKPLASLSLDLDNKWSYLKTHGDAGWDRYPTSLPLVVPRVLDFLASRGLRITFFVVGRDATRPENRSALRSIREAGHEIGNHSFEHEPWLHLYTEPQIEDELARA